MLAIGKVTPLSPDGQPPRPPFSWLTRPHKEIPVLYILVLGFNLEYGFCWRMLGHGRRQGAIGATAPLGRPLFLYTPCFFPMSVYFKCILNQKLLLLT